MRPRGERRIQRSASQPPRMALKIAAPLSVIYAYISEYFGGAQNGLGSRITSNIANSKNAVGWAYVLGACLLGSRPEQHVYGGTTMIDRGRLRKFHAIAVSIALQHHVEIAWRDHAEARAQQLTIHRLANLVRRQAVDVLGHDPREIRRNVLHHHDGRQPRRQLRQQ